MLAMTANATNTQTCVVCNGSFHPGQMLYGARGHICMGCENEKEQQRSIYRGVWLTVAGGPALAIMGMSAGIILALLHPVVAAVAFMGFGIAVIVHAVRAVMLAISLMRDYAEIKVGPLEKGALFLSAALSAAWGASLGLIGLMIGLGWLATM